MAADARWAKVPKSLTLTRTIRIKYGAMFYPNHSGWRKPCAQKNGPRNGGPWIKEKSNDGECVWPALSTDCQHRGLPAGVAAHHHQEAGLRRRRFCPTCHRQRVHTTQAQGPHDTAAVTGHRVTRL